MFYPFEDDFDDEFDELEFEEMMLHRQPIDLLQDMLHHLTVGELRQMARRRVWKVKGTRKDDIVEQVAQQLLDSMQDPNMLDDLTKDEYALLAATNTLFGLILPVQPEQFDYIWKNVLGKRGTATNTVNGLITYGLFIKIEDQWEPDYFYYQPLLPIQANIAPVMPLVAPVQKRWLRRPPVPTFPAPSFVNQIERVGYYAAAGGYMKPMAQVGEFPPEGHDSPWIGDWPYLPEEEDNVGRTAYFRYLAQPPIMTVPIRPHLVDQETFHALRDVTNSWETLDMIVMFLLNTGLLYEEEEERKYVLDAEGWQRFLQLTELQKLEEVVSRWQAGMMDMIELRQFLRENPSLTLWRMAHPEIQYRSFLIEFVFVRQLIIRLLRGLAEDKHYSQQWFSLEKFIKEVRRYRPDVYHMLSTDETWGFKKGDYLITLEEPQVWEQAITTMLQSLFSTSFYWLGMIDLHIRQGKIEAFRLTDLGRYLLSPHKIEPPAETESSGEAEWIDGQTIKIIPGREVNELIGLVSRIALPAVGQTASYRIGGPGLEGIFADGETPQTLAAQFETLGYPLPPAVQKHLATVYERFGRVHLYDDLTVVEFSDDTALVELRAAGLLKDLLLYEFSPRLIAIDPDKADELAQTLEKKGYTPKVTEEANA